MTPSLHGVPSVRFPRFFGTMSHYDFLPCFPVGFVFLRLLGTDSSHGRSCPLLSVSRLRAPRCPMRDSGDWLFCIPQAGAAKQTQTRQDLSRSQATLMLICPVLGPRQDLTIRLYYGLVLLPSSQRRKLPRYNYFEAQ